MRSLHGAIWFSSCLLAVFVMRTDVVAQTEAPAPKTVKDSAELRQPDYSVVVVIDDLLQVPSSWSYPVDSPGPASTSPGRELSVGLPPYPNSFALSAVPSDIIGVLQESRTADARGNELEQWNLVRVKMSTGQQASPIKLFARQSNRRAPQTTTEDRSERLMLRAGALLSVGRQGDMGVVKTNDAGRLDVWSLKGRGNHICGWKPYSDEEGMARKVLWAAAISDEIVLTLNVEGRLIRWKLPECKAVYERRFGKMSNATNWPGLNIYLPPGLSPGHSHMAVWAGSSLLLVDVLSGKTHGVMGGTHPGGWMKPTFSPDGTKLACTEADNFTQVLVIYDLKTGSVLSRTPLPNDIWKRPTSSETEYGGFTWVSKDCGVVGGKLMIDLGSGRPIWKFDRSAEVPGNSPPMFTAAGPLFWYYAGGRERALNAIALPHREALVYAKKAPDSFAAGPGSTVNLDIQINATADIREALRAGLLKRLERLGMKEGKGSRVTLALRSQIQNTGSQALVTTTRGYFPMPERQETVSIEAIILTTAFLVDGKEVWSHSTDFLPRSDESWQPDPKLTTQQELLATQWARVKQYASSWLFDRVPGYVMDPAASSAFPSGALPTPQGAVGGR